MNINTGNLVAQFLQSASRTANTVNIGDKLNNTYRGIQMIINVSAFVSGTYTPKIYGKDPISGNYYEVASGDAISGTGIYYLTLYPGVQTTSSPANAKNGILPVNWTFSMIGASTPSMTFSVAGFLQI